MIIAVFGSPNSGKTTLAVKLAVEMSKEQNNVLIITTDRFIPAMELIIPNENRKSIGKILDMQHITKEDILKNCNVTANKYISVTGYAFGENAQTYTTITMNKGLELLEIADRMAQVVIVDCSSLTTGDPLTEAALVYANKAVWVLGSDIKTVAYCTSNLPLLKDRNLWPDQVLKVMNNIHTDDPVEQLQMRIGKTDYQIPHDKAWRKQFMEMRLFDRESSKATGKIMSQLVSDLFESGKGVEHEIH